MPKTVYTISAAFGRALVNQGNGCVVVKSTGGRMKTALTLALAFVLGLGTLPFTSHLVAQDNQGNAADIARVVKIDDELVVITHTPNKVVTLNITTAADGSVSPIAGVDIITASKKHGIVVVKIKPNAGGLRLNGDDYPIAELPGLHMSEEITDATVTPVEDGYNVTNSGEQSVVVLIKGPVVPGNQANTPSTPGIAIVPPGETVHVTGKGPIMVIKKSVAATYTWTAPAPATSSSNGNKTSNPSTQPGSNGNAPSNLSGPQDGWQPPKPGDPGSIPTPTKPTSANGMTLGSSQPFGLHGVGPQGGYFTTNGSAEVNTAPVTGVLTDEFGGTCHFSLDLREKTFATGSGGVNIDLGWMNVSVSGFHGSYKAKATLTCTTTGGFMPGPGPDPGPGGGDDVVVLPGPGGAPDPGAGEPDPGLFDPMLPLYPGFVIPGGPGGTLTTQQLVDVEGSVYGINFGISCPIVQYVQGAWSVSLSATVGFMWVVETIDRVNGQSVSYDAVEEFVWTYGGQVSLGYSFGPGTTLGLFGGATRLNGGLDGWGYTAGVAFTISLN